MQTHKQFHLLFEVERRLYEVQDEVLRPRAGTAVVEHHGAEVSALNDRYKRIRFDIVLVHEVFGQNLFGLIEYKLTQLRRNLVLSPLRGPIFVQGLFGQLYAQVLFLIIGREYVHDVFDVLFILMMVGGQSQALGK